MVSKEKIERSGLSPTSIKKQDMRDADRADLKICCSSHFSETDSMSSSSLSSPREMVSRQKSEASTPPMIQHDNRAPFRRCHSKPENPTSNIGARAIEEQSRKDAQNGKKLIFMRNFSISEEDIVICNRVRRGVDPSWFRGKGQEIDRRYLRSHSIEDVRLEAARRRFAHEEIMKNVGTRLKKLVVKEDEPFIGPVIEAHPKSPRKQKEVISPTECEEELVDSVKRFCSPHPDALTPREKAMHGRYLIRESFANGSYGKVCAGEDSSSHREVAVKIIPKYILISPEEKQSVIREEVIHKGLDHPHIIKLIDVFEDDGAHYFILERARSGNLTNMITYSGMEELKCKKIFRQIVSALDYLHRNNIVHHDIKPHNVLIHEGSIKLCDFGASRAFNGSEQIPFAGVFGTPGYIAPELLNGEKIYGPAIDMYSSGVLLFEMTFGYSPFYPPSSCTYQPLEFPSNTKVSAEVKDLLKKLLERDPKRRITAKEALNHPWLRELPQSPKVSTPKKITSNNSFARSSENAPFVRSKSIDR